MLMRQNPVAFDDPSPCRDSARPCVTVGTNAIRAESFSMIEELAVAPDGHCAKFDRLPFPTSDSLMLGISVS